MTKVLVHIVVHESYPYLAAVLESLRNQIGDFAVAVQVTENGPSQQFDSSSIEQVCCEGNATLFRNDINLGFSAAHNQAVFRFLRADFDYLLVLNPDLALKEDCLGLLLDSLKNLESKVPVYASPLLLRASETLAPLEPEIIDSAGIVFSPTLRHFDRYAERKLQEVELCSGFIVGGSGACLLFPRAAIEALVLPVNEYQEQLYEVFPELKTGADERVGLFDEAFFAYREDAELALRAQSLGVRGYLNVEALGYHVRRVTPERRKALTADVNRHSVRNRFLLQVLHWSPLKNPESILPGFLFRNLLVLFGVFLRERSSLAALKQVCVLWKRAWARRRYLKSACLERPQSYV